MQTRIAAAAVCAVLFSLCADAQTYPAKPVRVIVPFAAGGNTDFTARSIAERLSPVFKQQVIVDNRPGGATNIGTEAVARAAPDGYTLLMGGASNAINMSMYNKLPYDTLRDFDPIILCVQGANVLVVHPSVPAKNLKELIALAKAQPGKLTIGNAGIGTGQDIAARQFEAMTG